MTDDTNELFESMKPGKALAIMAIPTIASQVILLVYNLADTWFIGRTNNPYMIAASSLAVTVYLAAVALANVFGVGGGSLMIRLAGEKRTEEAGQVSSYSITTAAICSLVFSLLTLIFMTPLLQFLGASENTLEYGKQYLLATAVAGGLPTVLSMCIPQILRNAGYSKEAGIGVGLGSIMNIILDPLFMFVIFPKGSEVLGAGVATMLSNVISLVYFIVVYRRVSEESILQFPKRFEHIEKEHLKSLFSVGIPAAIVIIGFACLCTLLFCLFSNPIVGAFIKNEETVSLGAEFLRGRCFALPFMMAGYFVVNWMNAVDKGKVSFLLAVIRHLVLIIPIVLIFNILFGLKGLVWSQVTADVLNAGASAVIFAAIKRKL